jgi:hypothetical protein
MDLRSFCAILVFGEALDFGLLALGFLEFTRRARGLAEVAEDPVDIWECASKHAHSQMSLSLAFSAGYGVACLEGVVVGFEHGQEFFGFGVVVVRVRPGLSRVEDFAGDAGAGGGDG